MAWPGPQFQQGWNARPVVPTGWPGSWPPTAPVGYPGPPPPPPGVNSQTWLGGQWQINPMFRGQPTVVQPQTAWAPHPSWGVAPSAAPAFNPYKRIPNTGDADYHKTRLLKNPLGLENMIPAEVLQKQAEQQRLEAEKAAEEAAKEQLLQTPWLWVPKELSKSDEPPPSKESNGHNPTREVRASETSSLRHDPRYPQSHKQPQSASAVFGSSEMQDQQSVQRHQRRSSQAQPPSQSESQPPHRSQSQHIPSSAKYDASPARHRQTESVAQSGVQPSSAPAAVSSFAQYNQYLQQRQQPSRASESQAQPVAGTPDAPNPPRTPTHVSTASDRTRTPGQSGDEGFSAQRQLKPTFSSNIIRTPQHYSGTPLAPNLSTPTRKPTREGSKDDYSSSRLSRAEPTTASSPTRHGRDRSRSRFRPSPDSSDEDSPVRAHFHGPIYGPPTPVPGQRSGSSGTTASKSTATTRESSLASMSSEMSKLTVDTTPPSSATTSGVFLATFSDEPAGLLSPLIVGGPTPTKKSPRDLGRSHTYPLISSSSQSPPSTIPAIPEERSPANLSRAPSVSKTPRRSPSTHTKSPKAPKTPTSVARSRTYPTLDMSGEPPVIPPMPSPQNVIPPMPSPNRTVPSSRAPSRAPSRASSPSRAPRNPLPPPPMPSGYGAPNAVSSASASAMSQEHHRRRTQSQYEHSSSQHSSSQPPSSQRSSSHPYPSSTPRPQQPAPSPVYPSQHTHTSSHSHSQQHSQPQPQPQPPAAPPAQRKVRYGFWNRRGDHLIVQPASSSHSPSSPSAAARGKQYIVYAPRSLANPEELAHYPSPTEGWMNHRGHTLRYDPSVQELPESLPSHGEPPVKPYEYFVRYTYV